MFFESSDESRQIDTEDRSPDSRVTTALDEFDIPYRYLPVSRTFEAHLHLEYDRIQCVYIDSRSHWIMGVELRRISSGALSSDGPFDPRTANLLLRENHEMIRGGWSILQYPEEERRVDPEEEQDRATAALTELFNEIKNRHTHVIAERIVTNIDSIVPQVRFDGWQSTVQGEREVKQALRSALLKYKLHTDQALFDRAYGYIKNYYCETYEFDCD
jgi:hypothetical protein